MVKQGQPLSLSTLTNLVSIFNLLLKSMGLLRLRLSLGNSNSIDISYTIS